MPHSSAPDTDSRINVIESNNLESLADMCAMIMASYPLSDVFVPEKIIVMNLGMRNFLTQRITIQNKIAAMCDFKQVWQLIYSVFYELNPDMSTSFSSLLQQELESDSLEHFEREFRFNFYDRDHIKWNIYSQICRRPGADLKQFVEEYEQPNAPVEPLKYFDNDGPYKVDAAKEWLQEHADSLEKEAAEAAAIAAAVAAGDLSAARKARKTRTAGPDGLYDDDTLWSFINLDRSELFDRIKDYVRHDATDERAFELAAKLADTFDQYQIYRPQWILEWNNFSLADFENYEKNQDDPKNPINIFIEKQCTRYAQRRSGLLSAELRKHVKALTATAEAEAGVAGADGAAGAGVDGAGAAGADGAGAGGADGAAGAAADGTVDGLAGTSESSLNLSELQRAKAALAESMQEQAILKAAVDTIRNSFKQNVWQMKLWCLLRPGIDLPHIGPAIDAAAIARLEAFISKLDRAQVLQMLIDQLHQSDSIKLPFERVFVFGVSALPQVVIDFLNALAKHCQVFLLLFNPSPLFWADIRSDTAESFKDYIQHVQATRQHAHDYLTRLRRKHVNMPSLFDTLKRQDYDINGERIEGHPLLLSLGRQCKDMINMLLDVDPPISSIACFSEPLEDGSFTRETVESSVRETYTVVRGGTLLKYMQTAIFNLDKQKERYEIAPSDRSVVVHSCYTLRREVETLRDNLLRLFNEHCCPYRKAHNGCSCHKFGLKCEYASSKQRCQRSNLLPRDIVVMVPAINAYAPHITAVFGGVDPSAPDYIPFVISDQSETEVNTVAQALLRLLEINSERVTSVMVIELLNEPAISRRFGIQPSDVNVISSWLTENNVYWGLDQDDTSIESEISIPGSFSLGLDRMILGSLLGDTIHTPCFSEIEGNDSALLGKFWDFIQALRELRQYFTPEMQQTPVEWEILLKEKLRKRFFDDAPETQKSLYCVDTFISNLKSVFSHLKKSPRLTLPVFSSALRQSLTSVRNFTPYYGERVNFCTLVPMRSVPFKHIFILGLNDTDFPRKATTPAFNLIGIKEMFERGDRSPALDDRFLFLEAILSARESLYLSYIGQSPIDQTERNPSLVVTELLYYLSDCCQLPLPQDPEKRREAELDLGKAVIERLLVKERLNAYHADNYTLSPSDKEVVRATTGSLHKRIESLVADAESVILTPQSIESEAKERALAHSAHSSAKADTAGAADGSSEPLTLAQEANQKGIQPYELVLEDTNIWQMPSFNRSFINLQQAVHCESPILGLGNFSQLVGLPEHQIVDLNTILAFCKKPCRMFMQRKLGLSLQVNNKSKLSSQELFNVDNLLQGSILQELLDLPPQQQEEHLDYLAQKGVLPYGVFKDMLQEDLMKQYYNLLGVIQKHGFNSTQAIARLPSAKHYELQLYVPASAIYGENPISPLEILEKYNQGNQMQTTAISDLANLESVAQQAKLDDQAGTGVSDTMSAAAMEAALPDSSQQLSEAERAQPKLVASDGEALLDLHVTLQFEVRTSPFVVNTFASLKAEESSRDSLKLTNTILGKDCNFLLSAAFEAFAQYLYEPFPEAIQSIELGEDKAGVLPANSVLRQPARTPSRLVPITMIDKSGKEAVFSPFASGEDVERILKQLVIFYLQASCFPYPAGKYVISAFAFVEHDGDITFEIKQESSSDDTTKALKLQYDKEAAYFFKDAYNIDANSLLKARLSNFVNFLKKELVPHYQLTPKD